jgi:basic membrane protein A
MVSEEVKAKVQNAKEKINSGELEVFAGPITDQLGKVMVPAGSVLSDENTASLNWFVEGVIGSRKR